MQLLSDLLNGHVGHYTVISPFAVYGDYSEPNAEDGTLFELPADSKPGERAIGGSTLYGPMKVACERIISEVFPDRWMSVRLTSGSRPLDREASNRRMTYWRARVRDYAEILLPGPPDRLVAHFEVRDMAE